MTRSEIFKNNYKHQVEESKKDKTSSKNKKNIVKSKPFTNCKEKEER